MATSPMGMVALFVGPIKGPAMLKRTLDQRIRRAYKRLMEARLDGAAALIEQRLTELDDLLDQRIRMAAELQ